MLSRPFWTLVGVGAHALFALTVVRLFPFLRGGFPTPIGTAGGPLGWFAIDAALALQFGVLHSVLLHPAVRKRLQRWVPGPQYGCVFCAITCTSLLLTIVGWRPAPGVVYQLRGLAGAAVSAAFLLSWVGLVYSLSLTGLGYQTGWTPWWAWVRGRPAPRRQFEPRGAYRVLRHPVYLSMLGIIWLTPTLTSDRLLLGVVWTAYVMVGSILKDRRLVHFVGEPYREYQARVPGYPLIPAGPLGKVRLPSIRADQAETRAGTPAFARSSVVVGGLTAVRTP
jgi:protein-S-isoprenylcysteine O-methyltransferase Ste14